MRVAHKSRSDIPWVSEHEPGGSSCQSRMVPTAHEGLMSAPERRDPYRGSLVGQDAVVIDRD